MIPVRSRHCDKGVELSRHLSATDATHWEGDSAMRIFQPGNLPVIGTGRNSRSRVIGRTVGNAVRAYLQRLRD